MLQNVASDQGLHCLQSHFSLGISKSHSLTYLNMKLDSSEFLPIYSVGEFIQSTGVKDGTSYSLLGLSILKVELGFRAGEPSVSIM